MTRRPGLFAASLFSLGAFLGLATSAAFLQVDENRIRDSAMANATAPWPFAEALIDALEQRDVFGVVADDVRADQRRNLAIGTLAAAAAAVGIGVTISRRGARPDIHAAAEMVSQPNVGSGPG